MRTELRFPPSGGFYAAAVGADVVLHAGADRSAAVARLEGALTAPTKPQAEDWLVMLQAACTGGRRSEVGHGVALELYAGTLCRYPADVARQACADLAIKPRSATAWFPTLPELVAMCERLAAPRKAMLGALRSDPAANRYFGRTFHAPSAEEKAAVRQMADDTREALRATVARAATSRRGELPSIAGAADETGVTPQMRDILDRRGGGQNAD